MAGAPGAFVPARGAWQEAVIERIEPAAPGLKAFTLRPAAWRPFLAGQHVELRLTTPDGYQARRSYSVASAPEQAGTYEIGVARLEGGEVRTPQGFKEAYARFVEGGWPGLAASPAYGGQGLPLSLGMVLSEMICSANLAWGMYPGLSHGVADALRQHGSRHALQ